MGGKRDQEKVRKRASKVTPGGGELLKPFHWWQGLHRSLFSVDLTSPQREVERYHVEVPLLDWEDRALLYRDGVHVASSKLPAGFLVPGGVLDVQASTWGLRRMHFLGDDGSAALMTADPASAEGMRASFGQRYPRASAVISGLAVVVLLVALVLAVVQVWHLVADWDVVEGRLDGVPVPMVPAWLNATVAPLAFAAAVERALTVRYHWLIDAESGSLDDD